MIVKIPNTDGFDHYHVCKGCQAESSPDECFEDAENCFDVPCTGCMYPSKEMNEDNTHFITIKNRETGEIFEQGHDADNACLGSEFAINHLATLADWSREMLVVTNNGCPN